MAHTHLAYTIQNYKYSPVIVKKSSLRAGLSLKSQWSDRIQLSASHFALVWPALNNNNNNNEDLI